MPTIVSLQPKVATAMSTIKQAEAASCRENLNRVAKAVKSNQISDIGAMTERINLESKLNDTKTNPVKYVEVIKPQKSTHSISESEKISAPKNITEVIKNFHSQNQYSNHEKSQILMDQMNMLATNNIILHGLK